MIDKESSKFFRNLVADNKKSRKPGQPMNDIFETLLKTQDPNGKFSIFNSNFSW